jgi:hypothetical protein
MCPKVTGGAKANKIPFIMPQLGIAAAEYMAALQPEWILVAASFTSAP